MSLKPWRLLTDTLKELASAKAEMNKLLEEALAAKKLVNFYIYVDINGEIIRKGDFPDLIDHRCTAPAESV